MISPSFTVPVTLLVRTKSPTPDSYGNDQWVVTPTTVRGVYAPGMSSEIVGGRDTVTTQPTVYLPSSANLSAVDAVQIGGLTFEVDGEPQRFDIQANPFTGWIPDFPVVVKLRRVTG